LPQEFSRVAALGKKKFAGEPQQEPIRDILTAVTDFT
jgi:hypothetical protein